jgi:hypothetical protein
MQNKKVQAPESETIGTFALSRRLAVRLSKVTMKKFRQRFRYGVKMPTYYYWELSNLS